MPLNDILVAAIKMNVHGQKVVNVLHFKQTSADGALSPNKDLCLAIQEDIIPTYSLALSDELTFEAITAHRIKPTIGGTFHLTDGSSGSVTIDPVAPNVAALATLYSATLSRQGRGRIYIPGVGEDVINRGRITNGGSPQFVAFLDLLLGTIQAGTGATFVCGVYSKIGNTFSQFTSHELRARLATLRSRRMENP